MRVYLEYTDILYQSDIGGRIDNGVLNPTRAFSTDLRLDPDIRVIATPDARQWIRANLPGAAHYLQSADEDAVVLTQGKIYSDREPEISIVILYDINQILENAQKLHGHAVGGFDSVAMAAAAHEMVGHLPSVLSGQETGDRPRDEVRAFTRSVAFLEWWLEVSKQDKDYVASGAPTRFARILAKERKLLASWQRRVK